MCRSFQFVFAGCCALLLSRGAAAQISVGTAVDLALRNSNSVKIAEADVARAAASLSETKDAYLPQISLGSGLAYTNGFPLGAPSVVAVQSKSLLINFSQRDYIRAAHAGQTATDFSLTDARQQVILDTILSYAELDAVTGSLKALAEEDSDAAALVRIVGQRVDAGVESRVGLTKASLVQAQVNLKRINLEGEATALRQHLAALTGIPENTWQTDASSMPAFPALPEADVADQQAIASNAAVKAAYAQARQKQYVAFGQHRYLWRPEIDGVMQYGLFASFNNYQKYYQPDSIPTPLASNVAIGVQITLPIFDFASKARALEADADAVRAARQADATRNQVSEQTTRLQHSVREAVAAEEVARLQRELAQSNLDAIHTRAQAGGSTGEPAVTPEDEQNARIDERRQDVEYLSARLERIKAELNLLKTTGQIEDWAKPSLTAKP